MICAAGMFRLGKTVLYIRNINCKSSTKGTAGHVVNTAGNWIKALLSTDMTNLTSGIRFIFKTQQNFVNTVRNKENLQRTAITREWDLGQGSYTLLPYIKVVSISRHLVAISRRMWHFLVLCDMHLVSLSAYPRRFVVHGSGMDTNNSSGLSSW